MNKGDIVKLKDDGKFTMIVAAMEGDTADCIWRDGDQILNGKFTTDALVLVTTAEFIEGFTRSNPELSRRQRDPTLLRSTDLDSGRGYP
jgi:hypothetical protein